jgi:hypothetical protein
MTYRGVKITGESFLKATIYIIHVVIENGRVINAVSPYQISGTLSSITKEINKAYKQGHPVLPTQTDIFPNFK